jgi:glycosyltransferase involved in cell wall biosynthesis
VIADFRLAVPDAMIYVFDNNSTDQTAKVAIEAGAKVILAPYQGKGNVVRRMFADVEADVYVMVDGDATYDAGAVKKLIQELIQQDLDMVVGCRVDHGEAANYRRGHRWGNRMLTSAVSHIFGGKFTDMLSGYRAFSRRFVKSFPALTRGFEIETELTIHALELRMPYGEILTQYGSRPEGSESKLSTFKDGFRILKTIIRFYMTERPIGFFGILAFLLMLTGCVLFFPVLEQYLMTGLVPRLPTAILSLGLILTAFLSMTCGLILDTVTRGRHEVKRLAYLSIPRYQSEKNK